jgi:hypothetical protein
MFGLLGECEVSPGFLTIRYSGEGTPNTTGADSGRPSKLPKKLRKDSYTKRRSLEDDISRDKWARATASVSCVAVCCGKNAYAFAPDRTPDSLGAHRGVESRVLIRKRRLSCCL